MSKTITFTDPFGTTYPNVHIQRLTYRDGSPALVLCDRAGDLDDTVTVCLAEYGLTPQPGHVFIKAYAEGTGMPAALAAAGVVELTDRTVHVGPYGAECVEARIL